MSSTLLIDAGEGTQIRLQSVGVDCAKINAIAITHLHGDHVFGLLPLLQSISVRCYSQRLACRLMVIGPRYVCKLVEIALGSLNPHNYLSIDCREVQEFERIALPSGDLEIEPIRMIHQDCECYGYFVVVLVDRKKLRKVKLFVSGDGVCPPESVARLKALNPDIVIHEATYTEMLREEAVRTGHATSLDAAKLASEVGAKLLILTHISNRYRDVDTHLREAMRFVRWVYVAEDLAKYPLYAFK